MPEDPNQRPTVVPYGKAYGVDNVRAQDALKTAAIIALDEALADIENVATGFHLEQTDPERYRRIKDAFYPIHAADMLPECYEAKYNNLHFLKNWMVTLTTVGWKLAQAEPLPPSNVAEELAFYVIIQGARTHLEIHEIDDKAATQALSLLIEEALEDTDFLVLYNDELPPAEIQAEFRFTPVEFEHWFEPFNTPEHRGVVHPFILDA